MCMICVFVCVCVCACFTSMPTFLNSVGTFYGVKVIRNMTSVARMRMGSFSNFDANMAIIEKRVISLIVRNELNDQTLERRMLKDRESKLKGQSYK